VRAAAAGDATAYLTADAPPPGPGGAPAPLGPLALALAARGDFPVLPPLATGLALHAVHVWVGASSTSPASSGLHHDYHDNVYCVASGEKTFTLFPPAAARSMATVGRVAAVHATGRIVYEGQGDVGADGSDAGIRRAAAALGKGGAADRAQDGDDDDADLDAALAAAAAGEHVVDDFDDAGGESSDRGSDGGRDGGPSTTTDPPSFSTLDPATDAAKLPMHRAATVTLRPGDALFLPAGWFHSVVSRSGAGGADARLHAAVSWWFHPPDVAERGRERAYTGDHWGALWRAAVAACPALEAAVAHASARAGVGDRASPAPKPAKRARGEE